MTGGLILAGYVALIWQAGWWGAAAAGVHVGLLLLAVRASDGIKAHR